MCRWGGASYLRRRVKRSVANCMTLAHLAHRKRARRGRWVGLQSSRPLQPGDGNRGGEGLVVMSATGTRVTCSPNSMVNAGLDDGSDRHNINAPARRFSRRVRQCRLRQMCYGFGDEQGNVSMRGGVPLSFNGGRPKSGSLPQPARLIGNSDDMATVAVRLRNSATTAVLQCTEDGGCRRKLGLIRGRCRWTFHAGKTDLHTGRSKEFFTHVAVPDRWR